MTNNAHAAAPRHCVGRREQGLEYVRREVTYDRHNDAVTGEVIRLVVVLRKHIRIRQPHQSRRLAAGDQAGPYGISLHNQDDLTA